MVPDTIIAFSKEIIDPITNIYTEIYIEFINGFKGKIAFNKKDENWQGKLYKHYDFFSEISVNDLTIALSNSSIFISDKKLSSSS